MKLLLKSLSTANIFIYSADDDFNKVSLTANIFLHWGNESFNEKSIICQQLKIFHNFGIFVEFWLTK